jgi:hypothetical protein
MLLVIAAVCRWPSKSEKREEWIDRYFLRCKIKKIKWQENNFIVIIFLVIKKCR